MESKADLRLRYRRERQERYVPHSFTNLCELPEISAADAIASYYSYGYEPSTHELNRALLALGKKLFLPRTHEEDIEWVQWNGDENLLSKKQNFLEPMGDAIDNPHLIDIVIVPALRIDSDGYRLGQGGGFYDRSLPHLNGWSIGLIHPHEFSNSPLPHDPWDVPLNAAATSEKIVRFKRN